MLFVFVHLNLPALIVAALLHLASQKHVVSLSHGSFAWLGYLPIYLCTYQNKCNCTWLMCGCVFLRNNLEPNTPC